MIEALGNIAHNGTQYAAGDVFDGAEFEAELVEDGAAKYAKAPVVTDAVKPEGKKSKKNEAPVVTDAVVIEDIPDAPTEETK